MQVLVAERLAAGKSLSDGSLCDSYRPKLREFAKGLQNKHFKEVMGQGLHDFPAKGWRLHRFRTRTRRCVRAKSYEPPCRRVQLLGARAGQASGVPSLEPFTVSQASYFGSAALTSAKSFSNAASALAESDNCVSSDVRWVIRCSAGAKWSKSIPFG